MSDLPKGLLVFGGAVAVAGLASVLSHAVGDDTPRGRRRRKDAFSGIGKAIGDIGEGLSDVGNGLTDLGNKFGNLGNNGS